MTIPLSTRVKAALFRIRALRDWHYRRHLQLGEWSADLGGNCVTLQVPADYLASLEIDDRKGRFTGIDMYGRYEYALSHSFYQHLRDDSVVFDIGAGYGVYSLLAYSRVHKGMIVAFEPSPNCNWVLRCNKSRYCDNRLIVESLSVGARPGEGYTTIDQYCRKTGISPTLMKIDIEGYECRAIPGMEAVCNSTHPTLFIEFHHRKMRDLLATDPEETLELLRGWGYTLSFNGHHWFTGQSGGAVDRTWQDQPPNKVNYAVLAELKV